MLPNPSSPARLRPIKWRMKHSSISHKALFWSFLIVSNFTKLPRMESRKGRSTVKMFHFRCWLIMCCMRGAKKSTHRFHMICFHFLMALSPYNPLHLITKVRMENHSNSANSHTFSVRIPSAIIMRSSITHYLSILITNFSIFILAAGPGHRLRWGAADLYLIPVRQI